MIDYHQFFSCQIMQIWMPVSESTVKVRASQKRQTHFTKWCMQIFLIHEILLTYYSIFFLLFYCHNKKLKIKNPQIFSGLFFFHTYCNSYGIQDNEEGVPEIKKITFQ